MNPEDIIRYQDYDSRTRTYVITDPVFEETSAKKLLDDEMFAPIKEIFKQRDARRKSVNNVLQFPNKNRYK